MEEEILIALLKGVRPSFRALLSLEENVFVYALSRQPCFLAVVSPIKICSWSFLNDTLRGREEQTPRCKDKRHLKRQSKTRTDQVLSEISCVEWGSTDGQSVEVRYRQVILCCFLQPNISGLLSVFALCHSCFLELNKAPTANNILYTHIHRVC